MRCKKFWPSENRGQPRRTGGGPRTRQRLLEHFGSVRGIRQASPDALTAVVSAATAEEIRRHFESERLPDRVTSISVLP
jgi:excinuclease ABC subunit C